MENTKKIVDYSRALTFDRLPKSVVAAAKSVFLDTLGALFAAWPSRLPAPRILGEYVRELGGPPECTVFGHTFKAPAPNAALINGLMGYAADIEGGLLNYPPVHAASICVPTALVMGERQRSTGAEVLAALALGYDVADRVSKAGFTPSSYPHSFHPSAIYGTFGAVAIAGHLMGLDAQQFINAFGLAGNIASGLVAWVDDPTEHSRPFGNGLAAHNGVMAALLASRGFGGPQGVFDGPKYNIFDAYSGTMNLEGIARGLGTDFAITRHDGFKKYSCCYDIHSGLDALIKILNEHDIPPGRIAGITHQVKEVRRPIIDDNPLRSHNAQYILSVAAVERGLRLDDFMRDRRTEPEIGAIYQRTRLVGSAELADCVYQEPAIVQVETTDGEVFTERVEVPRGHSANPLTPQELEQKFFRLAVPVAGEANAHRIVELVGQLETLPDIGELVKFLAG